MSAAQARESAVCVRIPPPSWTSSSLLPHPSGSSQNTELSTSGLIYTRSCACVSPDLPGRPTLLTPPCVHVSILYIRVSIPALQVGSSVPFLWIPHTCVNIPYLSINRWMIMQRSAISWETLQHVTNIRQWEFISHFSKRVSQDQKEQLQKTQRTFLDGQRTHKNPWQRAAPHHRIQKL